MPTVQTKKADKGQAATQTIPAPTEADDAVVYPTLMVSGVEIPPDKTKLTYDALVDLIGWESETDYQAKVAAEAGHNDPSKAAGFKDAYTLTDEYGSKVRLHNNDNNRPFDDGTSLKYAQDTLDRDFALNGETIIISRSGQVLSGQHRITGAIRAIQRFRKCRGENYPKWDVEPYIESLVVTGIPDDPKVIATLDNVRPRTLADTIYTSPVFRKYKAAHYRQQLSVMLDKAIDALWKRTGANEYAYHEIQTHAASFDFLARHPKLKDAVIAVFEADKGDVRKGDDQKNLQGYGIGLGNLAASLYLMWTAGSDAKAYAKKGRTEKSLDFSLRDKGTEFLAGLAATDKSELAEPLKHLRKALMDLLDADPETTMGGRVVEKLSVLAAGWDKFGEDARVMPSDLKLTYVQNASGQVTKVADPLTFGGIDVGPYPPKDREPEEGENDDRIAAEKAEKDKATVKADTDAVQAQVESLRSQNKGRTLLVRNGDGTTMNAFGSDAKPVAAALDLKIIKRPGGYEQVHIEIPLDDAASALRLKGLKPALVTFDVKGGAKVEELKAPFAGAEPNGNGKPVPALKVAPKATPAAKPKAAAGPKLRGGTGS